MNEKWIMVKEKLPTVGEKVLVCGIEGIGNVIVYGVKTFDRAEGGKWKPLSAPSIIWYAWQPLPKPPTREEMKG